jgi:hypothetical protein
MSQKRIKNVIAYLESTAKLAHAVNEISEEEKEIAQIIDDKIAEFREHL